LGGGVDEGFGVGAGGFLGSGWTFSFGFFGKGRFFFLLGLTLREVGGPRSLRGERDMCRGLGRTLSILNSVLMRTMVLDVSPIIIVSMLER
jgi:hypothetical protein